MKTVSKITDIQDTSVSDLLGEYDREFPYAFFLFYPKDFTFVCPTEVLELNSLAQDFINLGCEPFAVSSDSVYCHKAWLDAPTEIGGLGGMVEDLMLVSDEKFELASEFSAKNSFSHEMNRVSVIYDRVNLDTIYYLRNPSDVGRNVEDALRVLRQYVELDGDPDFFCPRKSLVALRKSEDVFPSIIHV